MKWIIPQRFMYGHKIQYRLEYILEMEIATDLTSIMGHKFETSQLGSNQMETHQK